MDGWTPVSLCAVAALVCGGCPALGQPIIGTVGDGLSDEYFENGFSYATSWPGHLVLERGINFGPTAMQASQPGGTWGEPRRTGYKYNWARASAATQVLLQQGQHTGLAAQAATDGVNVAVVFTGGDNFHFAAGGAYEAIYDEQWTAQQIQDHIDSGVGDIASAATMLQDSGMRVILVNVPDHGYAPTVITAYPDPSRRQRVTNAIAQMNAHLADFAKSRGIMLVDVFSLQQTAFGPHHFNKHTLLVGNREIALTQADTATNARPWAGFVHDGVHPHTTLQGVKANLILTALNMGHNTGILLLTEAQILARASLTYGGMDTLILEIGEYQDYIGNYACFANCDRSTTSPILNVDDFTCFVNLYAQNDPLANCDGSTTPPILNVDDFTCFVNHYAQGCH